MLELKPTMASITSRPATQVMPFTIRPLTAKDVAQSGEIEREAFPTLSPPTSFQRELKKRMASYFVAVAGRPLASGSSDGPSQGRRRKASSGGALRALLESVLPLSVRQPSFQDEPVVGFGGTWHMSDEAHIVSVGVRTSYRRMGIGELLLIAMIEEAVRRGSRVVTLEVRPSNQVARALYSKYGFTDQGVRKSYYSDNREDALIMTTAPVQYPPFQTQFEALKQAHSARWGEATVILR